jgi:mannose-6-phosphate isomerase-like protein (cupin superfamily)
MEKEVKVVDSNTMEPETTKTGSRIKRLITKAKDGSDNITFSIGIIAGGIDIIESFESDAVYYMIEGKSTIEWDSNSAELTEGVVIYIPARTEIRYRAEKDHKLISIFSPARI